ncbi:MAG: NAD(+) diphosphatase [Magnetospirillum sp.]|nr:NAD(+) diphosphatase [Magnetospirillum sp.]
MMGLHYTAVPLERAAEIRRSPERLNALLSHSGLEVVPLWQGLSLVDGESPRAVFLTGEAGRRLLPVHAPVFLGVRTDGTPVVAVDLSRLECGEEGPSLGVSGRFADLRHTGLLMPADEAGILAYARAMVLWHRRHRYCGACGGRADSAEGGHLRTCPSCNAQHHPRTDPAVIMLVEDGDRLLLHRQRAWPPGMWSCLAGFVEPGETLEEAVTREVREETGLMVADVRYVACQPWPFPASLMVAFTCRAIGGTLSPAEEEIEDARWFDRAQLAAFADRHRDGGGGLFLARAGTVARFLVERWLGG